MTLINDGTRIGHEIPLSDDALSEAIGNLNDLHWNRLCQMFCDGRAASRAVAMQRVRENATEGMTWAELFQSATITTESNAQQHREFAQLVQDNKFGEAFHWKLTSIECGAYVWECEEHERYKVYCTPFFEGYPRVCFTFAPFGESPSVGDPVVVTKQSLTVNEFLRIVRDQFAKFMQTGEMPATGNFQNHLRRATKRRARRQLRQQSLEDTV